MGDSGDSTAPFFGFIGAAAALVFSSMGAAYGTAKSGVGIAAMGVMRPELVMKSIVPVVMAGVLGIYGFIISVLIAQKVAPTVRALEHHETRDATRRRSSFRFSLPAEARASDRTNPPSLSSLSLSLSLSVA